MHSPQLPTDFFFSVKSPTGGLEVQRHFFFVASVCPEIACACVVMASVGVGRYLISALCWWRRRPSHSSYVDSSHSQVETTSGTTIMDYDEFIMPETESIVFVGTHLKEKVSQSHTYSLLFIPIHSSPFCLA